MEPLYVTFPIRLGQALKLAGIVENGAHAREVIASGDVTVNGVEEVRRGRHLAPGDIVALDVPDGQIAFELLDASEE